MNPGATPVSESGTISVGDLTVHRLGFGAMRLTGPGIWGPPRDPAECVRVLKRAVQLGVNFIDTADAYGPHVSEELIREALHPYPDGLVIATKAGCVRAGPDEWHDVGRPEYLRQQCELSLRRLGIDCIDLYQLHRIDAKVPAEEQFGAMAELRQAGKIRNVGLSEVSIAQIEAARRIVPIVSVQNAYNLVDRHSDDVLRHCEREGIAFIPWYPIAAGELAARDGRLARVAAALDATPAQMSLAWLLHSTTASLPIPGTSSVSHLEENCVAACIELAEPQLNELTAITGRR